MAHPTQLTATEQDTLVKQIGLALLRMAPRDWKRITADYRAVGRYHELDGEVTLADGSTREWAATHDIASLFGRLRAGMYREQRGTWFNASYQLDAPSSYNLEYDREEPRWHLMPPPQAYADELRMFPRSEDNVPEWLMRRMAGLGPERPGPRFRIARVFDGTGPSGRPMINRPELDVEEQDESLGYLNSAPVVLPGRGLDIDRLATNPEPGVPVAFHSDGTWIWPAAVNYYLESYGVSPEPDLVEHIRNNSYTVPELSEDQRAAANAYLTRGNPPQPPMMPAPPPPMQRSFRPPAPQAPQPQAPQPPSAQPPSTQPASAQPPPAPAGAEPSQASFAEPTTPATPPAPPAVSPTVEVEPDGPGRHTVSQDPAAEQTQLSIPSTLYAPLPDFDDDELDEFDEMPYFDDDIDAEPAPPSSPEPEEAHLADEPALKQLRGKLDELGIDEAEYTIGAPTRHGWSLEQVAEGWRVGWYDETLTNPALFGDADDAAAFMLGKLLLVPRSGKDVDHRHEQEESSEEEEGEALPLLTHPAEPAPPPAPGSPGLPRPQAAPPPTLYQPPPAAAPSPHAPSPSTPPSAPSHAAHAGAHSAAAQSGAPSQPQPGQQWPIQPLPGEPPLTLFRGKELQELAVGSELDRFGTPEGNLTYEAGTPFSERSLVPEWVSRPYHVYRVQRPIEALAGVAIPWFGQPGGGASYLLPASIEELLANGVLIELDPGEPPID